MITRAAIVASLTLAAIAPAVAQSCPEPLASARRLALVTAPGMDTSQATLRLYERSAPGAPWRAIAPAEPALIGKTGMAWSLFFRTLARRGEPVKTEGDKRAPAGFYRIGGAFGFGVDPRPGYTRIAEGMTCVDDPASAHYNRITTRRVVGNVISGENMWRVPEYRRGLFVDYPTDRGARAGSCIFIHLRVPGKAGTGGCVALPEARLTALQDFAAPGAVLGIMPQQALSRLAACLPAN